MNQLIIKIKKIGDIMKKIKINNKGLTLIEIILSITIFSIIMVMITSLYLNFSNFHNKIEQNSLENTNIVNTINSIKYRIDGAKDLQILDISEIEKNKNLGKEYKYICFYNKNIIAGTMGEKNFSEILNKNQLKNKNINLIFENKNNGLNINLNIDNSNILNIDSFVNLYNMKNNNISIKGKKGNAIIYKSDEK